MKWQSLLRAHFSPSVYEDWIRHLGNLIYNQAGHYEISVPSVFIKHWIELHYWKQITDVLSDILEKKPLFLTLCEAQNNAFPAPKTFGLNPLYTFDTFVVGDSNRLAFAAMKELATHHHFSPLFLYGPSGHGKTHLMHSIMHFFCHAFPEKKIVYFSAEKFMHCFLKALKNKESTIFKDQFRHGDLILFDDIQFLSGKASTQEEFYYIVKLCLDYKKVIVMAADRAPAACDFFPTHVRSRLSSGLVADMHPTTYHLRVEILSRKLKDIPFFRDFFIPQEVVGWLATHITSSVRELEGSLTRLAAHSRLMHQEITLDMARMVLRDMVTTDTALNHMPSEKQDKILLIQEKTAAYYAISLEDMLSQKRSRHIVKPRQVAMFLAKYCTTISLPMIGYFFGNRTHTTVMHSIEIIEQAMLSDSVLSQDVMTLKKMINNPEGVLL